MIEASDGTTIVSTSAISRWRTWRLGAQIEVGGEVAADPTLETFSLADVEHFPRGILPQVYTGAFWEGIELALQRFGKIRNRHRLRRRRSPPASATPSAAVSAR